MIHLNIELQNPWTKENFKNIFCRGGRITEHKWWEVEIVRYAPRFLGIGFEWSLHTDHAGVKLELTLFGYEISASVLDNRHWDYDKDTWVVYNES